MRVQLLLSCIIKIMFEDIKNNIDFFIRSKTAFSRKNYEEKDENALNYNFLENLYTFDILSAYFNPSPRDCASVLDIGCKNWSYVKGEYNFFKTFCSEFVLDGVEIDAHRLYKNFYSRYEYAKFYMKGLKNTNYIEGNLLDIERDYDFIIWFLPFVTQNPHIYWGLPKKFFMPEKLLQHAYSLLKKQGQLLIVNQGKDEADIQKQMLDKLNIKYEEKGIVKSEFLQYKNDRYAFLIEK